MAKSTSSKVWIIVLVLFGLLMISSLTALIFSVALFGTSFPAEGNVALIPITGEISTDGSESSWGEITTSSTDVMSFIEEAEKNNEIKAILFEIDSPGGSAVASKEIVDAIKQAKKPKVAVIRELGASGAYWAASATDHIIADELSVTGSIGVLSSYLEFSGLMEKYGVKYHELTGGRYKDAGSPFKSLEPDEELLLKQKINRIHSIFIDSVAQNRNLSREKVEEVADGMFLLGIEAKEAGLVDEIGNRKTAEIWIKQRTNLTEVTYAEYVHEPTLLETLSKLKNQNSFWTGRGIASQFAENKLKIRT
ncbi:MAG: signal peptide peptidase SppA [Candidatus Woesearchaeota archaeon]